MIPRINVPTSVQSACSDGDCRPNHDTGRHWQPWRWMLGLLLIGWSLTALADPSRYGFSAVHEPTTESHRQAPTSVDSDDLGKLATALGVYGVKQLMERAGVDYRSYLRRLKAATHKRLTPSTSLYADPEGVHLESRYLNGDLTTRFSTDKDADLRLSLELRF